MGMCLGLYTLSDDSIRKILADPPLIWKVVAPDDPDAYETARKEAAGTFLQKLFGKKSSPPESTTLQLGEGECSNTDLDKAWHGIHYLLTSSEGEGNPPLDFLVAGGEEVGDIEVGLCPARAFRSDTVRRIHAALTGVDESLLRSRFNPAEMTELGIYPEIWGHDPKDDDSLGYCLENFAILKEFVAQAERENLGIVLTLG
jgi:hypothetical protein